MKFSFVLAALMMFMSMPTHCAEEKLSLVYDAALAGDGVRAIAALSSIDATTLDSKDASRAACIRQALLAPPQQAALPPTSNSILLAYRTYWQQSMMRTATRKEAEAQLKNRLDAILIAGDLAKASSESLDVASERARQAVEQEGLFALTGVTSRTISTRKTFGSAILLTKLGISRTIAASRNLNSQNLNTEQSSPNSRSPRNRLTG